VETVRMALGRPAPEDSMLVTNFQMAQAVQLSGAARENATLLSRDPTTQNVVTSTRTHLTQVQSLEETANRFRVELHKKWAIALACLVFTLIGPPLALRFPRGGVGMVVAASTGIFAVYWMGLIGGESLADRRVAGPVVTMWISNVVFASVGLILVSRMGRAGATVRGGGGWEEMWLRVRDRLTGRRGARSGSSA
jgi:lipopolysaccharide export system permease protein